ncbi:TetR/AcrR family transcriptional regulator [Nocardioides sp. LHD-245]|uniref:TetR/AcrR family transcriptional regulator n=1 Tax=Nocardioides sp. LHD-245 TaxID=3051387 RepID=UPI0027E0C69F|nr:TetR/AcrR family transcriptional regulator [Nocardioides sp. LHD-245]
MSSASVPAASVPAAPARPSRRRLPAQARSRERVERILDAAARLVVSNGVDGLTTRSIAEAAELPVASLYQYFADKEAVLLALCERDMAEMDDRVATDLALLADPANPAELTIASMVETAMRAFVTVYHRRPAFMQIWMRGRANVAIYDYGRHHNRRIAANLLAFGLGAGLLGTDRYDDDEMTAIAELAVEVGDSAFQLAFEHDPRGDEFLISQAIALVSGYLERVTSGR